MTAPQHPIPSLNDDMLRVSRLREHMSLAECAGFMELQAGLLRLLSEMQEALPDEDRVLRIRAALMEIEGTIAVFRTKLKQEPPATASA